MIYLSLFKGPRIQFKSFGEPIPHVSENDTRFFIAVSCHFNQGARNPRIAITIDGHSGELVAEQSVIQQSDDFFHGHHFAVMLLASDVSIICSVTDDAGTHSLSRLVTLNGEFYKKRKYARGTVGRVSAK